MVVQYLTTTARHSAVLRAPPLHLRSAHGLPAALWKNGHVRGSMLQQAGSLEVPRQYVTMAERHALLPRAPEPHSTARHGEPLLP